MSLLNVNDNKFVDCNREEQINYLEPELTFMKDYG